MSGAGLRSLDVPQETAEELYEHAPCGYLSALPDGTIVRLNQTLLDWTGYARESLLGKRLQDLLPLGGQVFYDTHYDPLLRMQGFLREIALDLVCASGRLLPVLINAVQHRDSAGQILLTRTMILDATERRTYEQELLLARRRAEQLAGVVQASADAILVTSAGGTVQTWNAGAERLFGYAAEEALGRQMEELIGSPGCSEFEQALCLARSGVQVQLETVLVRKDRTAIDVSLGLTPHLEAPGELTAVSAIIRDMTAWRRTESRLRQVEQLQSVATLAGGVAHEVNNQMAVVLGFGEFVLKALGADDPKAADVEAMVNAAARAAAISQQLLAFSRQLPIVRQEIELGELVNRLTPSLTQLLGTNRSLVVTRKGEARVSVDPHQIEQILLQLTSNARDAMSSGGQLNITIDEVRLTERDAHRHPGEEVVPGSYILVSVADTGSGMDRVTLARAFEPFFTTKPFGQGVGLGLAVVHGIVKQHGGHVWVTSTPGEGTTFRLYLPQTAPSSLEQADVTREAAVE